MNKHFESYHFTIFFVAAVVVGGVAIVVVVAVLLNAERLWKRNLVEFHTNHTM